MIAAAVQLEGLVSQRRLSALNPSYDCPYFGAINLHVQTYARETYNASQRHGREYKIIYVDRIQN